METIIVYASMIFCNLYFKFEATAEPILQYFNQWPKGKPGI